MLLAVQFVNDTTSPQGAFMDHRDVVLPKQVRLVLYALLTLASPFVAYFSATGVLGGNELALYAGISGAIALLAGLNVNAPSRPSGGGNIEGDPVT